MQIINLYQKIEELLSTCSKTSVYCGGAKTWALALGLSPTFYQQYVRVEEIMGEPRN